MLRSPAVRQVILLGPSLVLALLMIFHPAPYDDVSGELVPIAGWWTFLHTVQFFLFAFVGASVWILVDGLRGVAATVARVAAVIFVLFYDIGDAVAGIATGILAGKAASGALPEDAAVTAIRAIFTDLTKDVFFGIGILAWIAALGACAGRLAGLTGVIAHLRSRLPLRCPHLRRFLPRRSLAGDLAEARTAPSWNLDVNPAGSGMKEPDKSLRAHLLVTHSQWSLTLLSVLGHERGGVMYPVCAERET